MRSGFVTLLAIAACAFSACAAHDSTPPQHPVAANCQETPAGRYREMTWGEYYTRVKERAWRTGATVIWVHPPRVRVASNTKTACR